MATTPCRMVTYLDRLLPKESHDLFLSGLAISRDTLKPLYLHYHSANGHQTWQDGN